MTSTTKVKVGNFHSKLKKSYNKTVIDINFSRNKDVSTLKSDTHLGLPDSVNIAFSGRYILMSTSLKSTIA